MPDIKTPVVYASGKAPEWYTCAKCGAKNVKLWREYQTFQPQLLCVHCASVDQDKTNVPNVIDKDGLHTSSFGSTDQIGWYIPAVPDEKGVGFWGYASVPGAGLAWWRQLPTPVKG